jgi:uncharacterized protein YjbI with pentapeptide repeats
LVFIVRSLPPAIVIAMAEDKGTSTLKQGQEPTRRVHTSRVVVVALMVSLIALSIAVFFFAPQLYILVDVDTRAVLWGIRFVAGLVFIGALWRLIRIGYDYQWTGLGETELPEPENGEFRPKKTLWDWLQLLIVPFALVLISFLFTAQQDQRQREVEIQRAEAERELAKQRARDEALQSYLDQMSALMLEKDLRKSEEDSEVRTLARARTLTVLRRLDPSRKGEIMQFLLEADLIHRVGERAPVIKLSRANLLETNLRDADLDGADLSDAKLSGAHLNRSNLFRADLSRANLGDANLSNTNLREADLNEADLAGAHLYGANLKEANLSNANLRVSALHNADLSGANLRNAELGELADVGEANLSGANLSDANLIGTYLFSTNLSNANLSGAWLQEADLVETDLSDADLSGAVLDGANLRRATGITTKVLEQQAFSLEGAIMPGGSKHP